MAIVQTLTTSFKNDLLTAGQDLATDTLKLALYTANASLGADTTAYSSDNEVSNVGTGYTAGGETLTGITIQTSGSTVYINFDNAVWDPASFTARAALIYNSSKSNKSVAVLDFGSDKTCSTTFTIQMPANTAASSLLRFV
jgi:hypothetical protein